MTTRNERDIRWFASDANQNADTMGDPAEVDKVITGIMKQDECMKAPESTERADNAEPYGLGRGKESTDQGIKTAHIPKTDSHSVLACALTVNPHGSNDSCRF